MKATTWLFSLFILLNFITSIHAQDICTGHCPSNGTESIERLANSVSRIALEMDDALTKINATSVFLTNNRDNKKLKFNEAAPYLNNLKPICENANIEKRIRSAACLRMSGLHGAVARSLGVNGAEQGREAIARMKQSIAVDPNNQEALESQAFAIRAIMNENWFIRNMIASSLDVDIKNEARQALRELERANLTTSRQYTLLKSAVDNY